VNAKQMQRALLPARARLFAMCNRNTIAIPAAAQLPQRCAMPGGTAKSPQGERDV
jgi:hypothetical protein